MLAENVPLALDFFTLSQYIVVWNVACIFSCFEAWLITDLNNYAYILRNKVILVVCYFKQWGTIELLKVNKNITCLTQFKLHKYTYGYLNLNKNYVRNLRAAVTITDLKNKQKYK